MSAWNKFDVFIVILSCAEAIASLVIGQYVNDEINKMEGNTTSSLKILKLFKGMDFIKVTYCMHTVCMYIKVSCIFHVVSRAKFDPKKL